MGFDMGGAGSGAMSGAAMGSQIMPGWGTAAGALIGGLAGGFGGGDSAKDAAKYQMKYYSRYVLPKLQEEQRFNQMMNNQSLGTYTSSGNQAMNALTGLGTGQFGLTDVEKARLAELQAMSGGGMNLMADDATNASRANMQHQANQAELDALLEKQQMGGQLGGGGLGGFLQGHPLYEAMQDVGSNALNEQYAAAFGGVAPSTFMGEQLGRMGSENLLNTYSAIQDPLRIAAGLGGTALGQQVGNNTALAQQTMGSLGQFGNANALGSAQAGEGAWGNSAMQGLGALTEQFNPVNRAANKYLMDWFAKKSGGLNAPQINTPWGGR